MAPKKSITTVINKLLEDSKCGVTVNGPERWDPQIKPENQEYLFKWIMKNPTIAMGDGYMLGLYECDDIAEMVVRLLTSKININSAITSTLPFVIKSMFNVQDKKGSLKVAQIHYGLGNDFYEKMLGSSMLYTCGLWREADTLEKAEYDKVHLIAKKLGLNKGGPKKRVLEFGGGFGRAAQILAKDYNCQVVVYNITPEHNEYGRKLCKGLDVEFIQADYRESINQEEKFDAVFSIRFFEHVGKLNYRKHFELMRSCLKPTGRALVHTIGSNYTVNRIDQWLDKRIFPGGYIPTVEQIGKATEGLFDVVQLDVLFGDYTKTLVEWNKNLIANKDWIIEHYGEQTYRMYIFYMGSAMAGFRVGLQNLWQISLRPSGLLEEADPYTPYIFASQK